MATHPYKYQSDKAFWNRSISDTHVTELSNLFTPFPDLATAKFATAGSCFAQHIGRNLRMRDLNYMDLEKPPTFLQADEADALGYNVYSCRYGNIYTISQLLQLFEEAHGQREPEYAIWEKDERFYDALRPGLQKNGFETEDEVRVLRQAHLKQVKEMFATLDIFVFTMGLTEAWVDTRDNTTYPTAPGVIAGEYNKDYFELKNFRYNEIKRDLDLFFGALRSINSKARLLLTISPVPLAATATQDHVLTATTYSKSVLRAVAGDMVADDKNVYYFPSYELIVGQPTRHMFYKPDLRSVATAGVQEVMKHFFGEASATTQETPSKPATRKLDVTSVYEHCEESVLGKLAS